MTDVTGRLDAIDARLAKAAPGAITITPSDVSFLLDLARKQQAALEAVRGLHKQVEGYIFGAIPGAEPDYPVCSVCFDADENPEPYPCPTIQALEAKP